MSLPDDIIRLEEKVDDIMTHVASQGPTVLKLDREVFGNGRPGLATQMSEIKATQKLALKVLGSIGAAGLAVLTAIAVALLT
jgi:hypothetical protein